MNQTSTELVFILDKSGSMYPLEKDTIGGFNSMLEKQRKEKGDCRVTTVLFDSRVEAIADRVPIEKVKDMTSKEYQAGGCTALLDAIGITIERIKEEGKKEWPKGQKPKVLFVIITDGMENDSRFYTLKKVKKMIEKRQAKGWEFIFLGANIDAVETAGSMGIAPERAADYIADGAGTDLNFRMMSETISAYREHGHISEAPMAAIREDVKTRKYKTDKDDKK